MTYNKNCKRAVIVDRRTEITDIEKKHGVKVYSIIKEEDIEWAIRNKIV